MASRSRPVSSSARSMRSDQRRDDRVLVGRGEVGPPPLGLRLPQVAHRVEQRRLQPGEGEVEAGDAARRSGTRTRGIALDAASRDERRPAGEAEPEQPRALVERLAGGVVERAPEHGEVRAGSSTRASSVWPPEATQAQERRLEAARAPGSWRPRGRAGGRPARAAAACGAASALARRDADEQRADEARALGDGDRGRRRAEPRRAAAERVGDHGGHELEVVARGDLGHHAAVAVVDALRGDDVGADRARRRRRRPRRCRRSSSRGRGSRRGGVGPGGRLAPRGGERRGRAPHDHASSPLSW